MKTSVRAWIFCVWGLLYVFSGRGECADARIAQTLAGIEAVPISADAATAFRHVQGASQLIQEYGDQKRFDDAFRIYEALSGLCRRYEKDEKISYEQSRMLARLASTLAADRRFDDAVRLFLELSVLCDAFPENTDMVAQEAWCAVGLSYAWTLLGQSDKNFPGEARKVQTVVLGRMTPQDDPNLPVLRQQITAVRNLLLYFGALDLEKEALASYEAIRRASSGRLADREIALSNLKASDNMIYFYLGKKDPRGAEAIFSDVLSDAPLLGSDSGIGELQALNASHLLWTYAGAEDLGSMDIGGAYRAYGFTVGLRAAFDEAIFASRELEAFHNLILANCSAGRIAKAQKLYDQFLSLYADIDDQRICRYQAKIASRLLGLYAKGHPSEKVLDQAEEIFEAFHALRVAHVDDAEIALREMSAAKEMVLLHSGAGNPEEALNYYYRAAERAGCFAENAEMAAEQARAANFLLEACAGTSRRVDEFELSRGARIYKDVTVLRARFADDADLGHLQAKAAYWLYRLCRKADGATARQEMQRLTQDLDGLYRRFPSDFFDRLIQ